MYVYIYIKIFSLCLSLSLSASESLHALYGALASHGCHGKVFDDHPQNVPRKNTFVQHVALPLHPTLEWGGGRGRRTLFFFVGEHAAVYFVRVQSLWSWLWLLLLLLRLLLLLFPMSIAWSNHCDNFKKLGYGPGCLYVFFCLFYLRTSYVELPHKQTQWHTHTHAPWMPWQK